MEALVVADDAVIRREAERTLAGCGYRVTVRAATAGDVAAYQRGDDDGFDAVLLDTDALGDDLWAVCRCLRARPGGAHRFILLLGGDGRPWRRLAAGEPCEAGADGTLPKPLDPALLAQHLVGRLHHRARCMAKEGSGAVDLGTVIERIPAVPYVARTDAAATLLYVAPRIEALTGHPQAEWLARPGLWASLLHKDDRERVLAARGRANATGEPFRCEYRCLHRDGRSVWVRDEAEVVPAGADPTGKWYGLLIEIAEQKEAEAALRASEERLRLALDGAEVGAWEWDITADRTTWSGPNGPLFGLPPETPGLSADEFFALVHPDDRARVREADRRHLEEAADFETEYRVVRPDGAIRWLTGRGRAVARDGGGRAARVVGVTMDITARKEAEEALRASERRHRELLVGAERQALELSLLDTVRTVLARELDLPTLFRAVVEAIARTFGYGLVSLYLVEGRDDGGWLRLQHQVGYHQVLDVIPLRRGVMGRVARTGQPALVEDGRRDPDFMAAFAGIVSEVCVPLRDDGRVVGVLNFETAGGVRLGDADLRLALALGEHVGIAIGRARLFTAARESETRFRGAFDQAPIGMALVGTDGRWLRVNRALCAMLGYAESELLGVTFQDITHPDDLADDLEQVRRLLAGEADAYTMEKRYLDRHGRPLWAQLSVSLVRDDDGGPRYFVSHIEDISERKTFRDLLHHQALHDPLTGLPNRVLFGERLDQAIARPLRRGRRVAVLFLDLDGFKLVNDTLGHEAGDGLLAAVGRRLGAALGPAHTVARFGGDEFAVLLEEATAAEAVAVAERLIEALRPPFAVGGRETFVGASVGVARGGRDRVPGASARALLREADVALYRAKAAGRGTYAVFHRRMMPSVVSRLENETALRRAVEQGEFRLRYQPQVDLVTGALVGFEALLRWDHPERGLLPPAGFIHLAEETGLIVPIGRWVLTEACRQARAWRERYPAATPFAVCVNLSARQFRRPVLAAEVVAAVAESGLDAAHLELEITESVLMDHADESGRTLATLRGLGARLAIDDFGTGYSSLAYLRRLPVDVLKVDRSFVRDLAGDDGAVAILRAVTTMAHDLGMTVTAEGVETAGQLARLRELGTDRGQGFYFAQPLTAEGIEELLGGGGVGGR